MDEDFTTRFNHEVELMLARKFKTSLPTIRRWMAGVSSPHPLMQESVFAAFKESIGG